MAKKKRKVPGLNASSTADISFILLIFFLVTTSMDTDTGLARRLPPPPEDENSEAEIDVKERNVLNVKVNSLGQIMVNGDLLDIAQLCDRAKEFVKNENNDPNLPEKHAKNIPLLGMCAVTDKHVISVQTDRGTSYNVYFQIQNEFNQFQSVEFVKVVLIEKLAALIIRTHFPAVGIGIIPDFDFSVQIPGDPFLNDFRRQPERAESEVDVFNGQRLRQNRFQRLHIGGQSPFAGFFDLHSDVPGKVTALELNLI